MERELDTSPLLPKEGKPSTKQILVTLLYYAREVDTIILVDLVSVSDNQANRNKTTAQAIKQLLD